MSAILAVAPRTGTARSLIVGAALLIPLLVYFSTAQSIVAIWNRSETFAHGYIIVPISLWLIWQRRAALLQMVPQPCWPAVALLAACGFGWLLGDLGEVQIVKQYAFTLMLPLAALAVLGPRIARAIAFPLLFLLFAVPFGEIFIYPLMDITANLTVYALRATGIPVLREGNNFSIPTGDWSVVEACSGLRYLIASLTLGCLYAYLTYRSRRRQLVFVLLSILVPVLANSGRAYMIVMIGHLSSMKLAVGADHLVYGWVFFGIVMFLLFWLGSFWREDHPSAEAALPLRPQAPTASATTGALFAAALAVFASVAIWPAYARYLASVDSASAPPPAVAFQLPWQQAPAFTDWSADFSAPAAQSRQFFAHGGAAAGLSVLYYRHQHPGSQLISSGNHLAAGGGAWRSADMTMRTEAIGARAFGVREEMLIGPGGRLIAWQWYSIDGHATSSDYVGKALQVRQRLLHGRDDGAALMVFARYDEHPEEARAVLRAFLAANLAPIDAALAGAAQH